MPPQFWRRAWKKNSYLQRLFGPTLARSTGACSRIARLRVLGNGVVVAQGALAWTELWARAFGGET